MPQGVGLLAQTVPAPDRAGTCEFGPNGPVRQIVRGQPEPSEILATALSTDPRQRVPGGRPAGQGRRMQNITRPLGPAALALVCLFPASGAAAAAQSAGGLPPARLPPAHGVAAGIAISHAAPSLGPSSGRARTARRAQRWRPPVMPPRITEPFDPPGLPWQAGHRGVDLVAQPGTTVRAAGAGRVTFAAGLAGRGVVVVDHGAVRTTYEPIAASVVVGQRVRAGDPLGTLAPGTGHCGGARCLHLGLRRGPEYLDPMLLLRRTSPRLRPW